LAVTIDNGFLSPTAVDNCRAVSESLGIDHVFYKPSFRFMANMYRKSIDEDVHVKAAHTRASSICNSCINVVNTHVIKVALQTRCRVIAGGYVGGQVPKDSAVMDLTVASLNASRARTTSRYMQVFGEEANHYVTLPDAKGLTGSIAILNPLLTLEYRVEDALEVIKKFGWKMPTDTGKNSSNCLLNDLGIHAHHKKYGFHPYVFELAENVRYGLMDRDVAREKAESVPTEAEVKHIAARLNAFAS
jgi:tRNA(Ile)-lysidine synthase TilS/MesJ